MCFQVGSHYLQYDAEWEMSFLKTSVSVEFKNKGLETLNASLHTEFITLFCLFPINCITQSLRRQIYLISLCRFYLSALETVVINSS